MGPVGEGREGGFHRELHRMELAESEADVGWGNL